MDPPLFSVVIPTHNRRCLLTEAVASVRAQTEAAWELLVVDDGSDDGTEDDFMRADDPRVRYLRLERSGIVGQVRNEGARRARGRWLAFLDSDDLWRPQKLARQRAALEASGAAWSTTGYDVIAAESPSPDTGSASTSSAGEPAAGEPVAGTAVAETRVLGVHRPAGPETAGEALLIGLLTTEVSAAMSSLAVARETFEALGGFATHPRVREDHDLVLRLAEAGAPHVGLPDTLMSIRHHGQRSDHGEPDPFDRSAIAYELFLECQAGGGTVSRRARAAARARLAYHRIASARIDHRHGDHVDARAKLRQVWNPGWRSPRWWLAWWG